MAQSDERLVELARQGNEAAFEAIIERYRGPLRRYCLRLAPPSRIDDVLQEAFVSAYHMLSAVPGDLKLRPWLFRVGHNAAIDSLRREARQAAPFDEPLDRAELPDHAAERRESLRRLVSDLSRLPARQRAALLLRELEGRSYEEISRELGVTGGAVRQLLYRARNGLRAPITAVTPPWLILGSGSANPTQAVERIAELAAVPGLAASAVKAAAVLATTGAIGIAALPSGGGPPAAQAGHEATKHPASSHAADHERPDGQAKRKGSQGDAAERRDRRSARRGRSSGRRASAGQRRTRAAEAQGASEGGQTVAAGPGVDDDAGGDDDRSDDTEADVPSGDDSGPGDTDDGATDDGVGDDGVGDDGAGATGEDDEAAAPPVQSPPAPTVSEDDSD